MLACYPVGLVNRGSVWALLLCAAGAALGLLTLRYNTVGNFSVYPEPRARARLITTGPYRAIRHPMYSALLLMMAGIALYNGHWLNAVGVVAVAFAVYGKALREERLLAEKFPDYPAYCARTTRFIPKLF